MSFRFHPAASDDLKAIYATIAMDGEQAAAGMIETLYRACQFLGDTPYGGRARPDLGTDLRSFPVGNYLLIYRVIEGGVQIIYVAHGRRDLAALVEREAR
jgi:toxin ParE1/3/4